MTTKSGDKVNTMTIGWGMLGVDWGKNVFIALVRDSRYTMQLLQENLEFTVNIPVGVPNKQVIGFCGTKSGANVDKIKEMNFTLVEPDVVSVPAIREFPLTLECKVLFQQKQVADSLPTALLERFYPENDQHQRDYHIVFYGEIVSAYIIED